MTVPATSRRAGPFTGNGVTTSFPFAFKTFAAADLRVARADLDGVETELILNSDYTVTLNGDQDASPGGNVILPSALTTGFKLSVVGNLDLEQTTDLPTGGAFNARVVEDALDRQAIFSQQLEEKIDRTLKVSITTPTGVSTDLPTPLANHAIAWNGAADALTNLDPASLATVVADAYTVVDKWTANGSTTTYVLSNSLASSNFALVSIAGVVQNPGVDYSISGALLTFTSAPPAATVVQARYIVASGQVQNPQAAFTTESFVATAAQTTFTLQTAYIPGANSLEVFVNGLRMNPATDYAETSATVVTFVSGLTAGDEVTFVVWAVQTIGGTSAASVAFTPAGAGAVVRDAQSKLRDVVSVKDFGAVGDGVTDDTAAIQAAIDATTGEIVFPEGTYKISAALNVKSNQSLIGDGATITMTNGVFLAGLSVISASNVRINGLKLVGASGGNSFDQAIFISASTNVTVENCLIQDIGNEAVSPNEWGHGIEIGGNSVNTKVVNNTIKNIKGYGNLRGDGITLRASSNTLIQGNTIDTNRRMQIAVIDNAIDVKIIGNHLLNGYLAGIDVEPNSVNTTGEITIQGNTIRNFGSKPGATTGVQYYGIDLHSNEFDNISVVGNIISAENAQAVSCIHGQNVAKFATITGNVLWCNGYADGMTLFSGNGFKNLVISGNIIREFAVNGITGDKNDNVVVDANILESSQATAVYGIRLTTGLSDPTYISITGNNVKINSGVIDAGIYVQAVNSFVISDNMITVASGDGIEVYSNVAAIDGATVTGNFVIDTSGGVNAYHMRAAGSGTINNCTFSGNAQKGFTNAVTVSGAVSFVKDVLDTYLGATLPGNNNLTLTSGVSARVVIYDTPITTTRTVGLSTTNAEKGAAFRITRTANCTGAFNINVGTGPLKSLTAAGQWCDVTFDGSAWFLTASGSL